MNHYKYYEVATLVKAGIPVLLTGERGSGKTTLIQDVAKGLNLSFFSMSMTRQTTLSHLLGFINVNGVYVPSQLRSAVEDGGVFLLDELDAADANVVLCLNTIENGYVAFPDKVVELHPDFRIVATSNPQDNHKDYNGRSKLDAATLDRFDIINVDKDDDLEQSLVDENTYAHMQLIRQCLRETNSGTYVSMRDSIRYQKRKELGLTGNYIERLLEKDMTALEKYKERKDSIPKISKIKDCTTLEEVWECVVANGKSNIPTTGVPETPW